MWTNDEAIRSVAVSNILIKNKMDLSHSVLYGYVIEMIIEHTRL